MSTMDYLEFKNHLEHSFTQKDKAEYYKNKDMNSIRVSRERLELAGRANAIKALVKQRDQKNDQLNSLYRDMERSGVSSTKTNSQQSSVANGKRNKLENEIVALDNEILTKSKDLISVIGMPMFERFMKGTSLPTDISYKLSHDNLEHASIAGVPSRLISKMQSAIYKKTGYQSKGSYAGAPNTAKQATTDQNKAVANARFSASIKSAIEACNRDAAEAQSVYVEATTRINNIVSRNRGEVNSIIRSVNEYNENVRNIRNQTITKKSTFSTVANGKLYQGVRDEQVPVDPNRQFISFSAGAQKISANKYVYKPKMLLIDSDPGTYKEV